jgi:hypothetical protein
MSEVRKLAFNGWLSENGAYFSSELDHSFVALAAGRFGQLEGKIEPESLLANRKRIWNGIQKAEQFEEARLAETHLSWRVKVEV